MRESLMYGSVRGTRGNSRPYRDARVLLHCICRFLAHSVALNPPCWGLLIEVKRTAMLRRGNAGF